MNVVRKGEEANGRIRTRKTYTTDYICSLPDRERTDLIDGTFIIWHHQAPNIKDTLITFLMVFVTIFNLITEHLCRSFPMYHIFKWEPYNYVEPDISVIVTKRNLQIQDVTVHLIG